MGQRDMEVSPGSRLQTVSNVASRQEIVALVILLRTGFIFSSNNPDFSTKSHRWTEYSQRFCQSKAAFKRRSVAFLWSAVLHFSIGFQKR